MKTSRWNLLACTLGCALGGAAEATAQETGTLQFKAHKNFRFILPADTWTPAAGGVAGFTAAKDGVKLAVDTTGDGRTNASVKGSKGYLQFQRRTGDKTVRYAARFQGSNGVYKYACSATMSGTVAGVPIHLIDLNNNGSFDEVGRDAIAIGSSKAAAYLSPTISHKGKVFTLKVTDGGTSATLTPFTGPVGKLDLRSGFSSKGKLASVIVSDERGNSFPAAQPITVPVGRYEIVGGMVRKGSQTARIKTGRMEALEVAQDTTAKLAWGGPLVATFDHGRNAGTVSVEPRSLHYFGKAGVEFYDWAPNAKSPKFVVKDAKSGREVGGFQFAGC